jgi:hypothetical protein
VYFGLAHRPEGIHLRPSPAVFSLPIRESYKQGAWLSIQPNIDWGNRVQLRVEPRHVALTGACSFWVTIVWPASPAQINEKPCCPSQRRQSSFACCHGGSLRQVRRAFLDIQGVFRRGRMVIMYLSNSIFSIHQGLCSHLPRVNQPKSLRD